LSCYLIFSGSFSGSVTAETKLGAKFLDSLVALDHNPTNQARQQRENPSKRPADSNKCWNMRFFFKENSCSSGLVSVKNKFGAEFLIYFVSFVCFSAKEVQRLKKMLTRMNSEEFNWSKKKKYGENNNFEGSRLRENQTTLHAFKSRFSIILTIFVMNYCKKTEFQNAF
jgi:hypothetical protein